MPTFEEFFVEMEKWAEENRSVDAQFFLENARHSLPKEKWEKLSSEPLTSENLVKLAQYISSMFKQVLMGTCTEKLYEIIMNDDHAFLRAMYEKAKEFGVEVDIEQIDTPLTMSDSLKMAQQKRNEEAS